MKIEKRSFGTVIKDLREARNLTLKDVSSVLEIDLSTLGKIEKNQRFPNKELISKLSDFFNVDKKQLIINLISDKVVYQVENEEYAEEILRVAEAKVKYLKPND
jgi:transcriptional regulator with XRE-family HTH domain